MVFSPSRYHHTISTTLLYGLREALALACQEGLANLIARHEKNSERLQEGILKMGLELFVKNPKYRLPTVNAIKVPEGIDWTAVSKCAMDK